MLHPSEAQGQFNFKIQHFEQLTVRHLIPAGLSPSALGPAQKQGKHPLVPLRGNIFFFFYSLFQNLLYIFGYNLFLPL